MKYIFTLALVGIIGSATFAQSKSSFFLNADISDNIGATLAYNYIIKQKLGVGVAIEVTDFSTLDEGSLAALADFRYYHGAGKSTIIPLLQIGKNLYDYEATVAGSKIAVKGGVQGAVGVGYGYNLWGKSGGLFTSFKYRLVSFKTEVNEVGDSDTDGNIVFSVGFRF